MTDILTKVIKKLEQAYPLKELYERLDGEIMDFLSCQELNPDREEDKIVSIMLLTAISKHISDLEVNIRKVQLSEKQSDGQEKKMEVPA